MPASSRWGADPGAPRIRQLSGAPPQHTTRTTLEQHTAYETSFSTQAPGSVGCQTPSSRISTAVSHTHLRPSCSASPLDHQPQNAPRPLRLPRARRFAVDLEDAASWRSSAKIDALISELRFDFQQEEQREEQREKQRAEQSEEQREERREAQRAEQRGVAAEAAAEEERCVEVAAVLAAEEEQEGGAAAATAAAVQAAEAAGEETAAAAVASKAPRRHAAKHPASPVVRKAVVFSQWVGMLELVQKAITRELGVKTVHSYSDTSTCSIQLVLQLAVGAGAEGDHAGARV